jgi:hypothetical protein
LGSGIATVGAISIGGALPANARDWAEYAALFDRSISDALPAGPLRPEDETAWKAVAKNYTVTNKITNLENGYWGIMANPVLADIQAAHRVHKSTDYADYTDLKKQKAWGAPQQAKSQDLDQHLIHFLFCICVICVICGSI